MTIIHKMLCDGGFVAGDLASGLTSYAYATSPNAALARKMPDTIAAEMIAGAKRCFVPENIRCDYDARNWKLLA